MPRERAIEPGTLLRVDLGDRWHTYARALTRPTRIAFFDSRVSTPVEDLRVIVERPVLFVVEVSDRVHESGRWPAVGHLPPDVAPIPVPDQFTQSMGSGACEVLDEFFNSRPATPRECAGLERSAIWYPEDVEQRLRDHYAGRPNAHLEHLTVRLAADQG